jgi:hypothetical protein
MAKIIIADLDNIDDQEFMINLNNLDSSSVFGGEYNNVHQILNYGVKALEFVLVIYAIDTITSLTKIFNK